MAAKMATTFIERDLVMYIKKIMRFWSAENKCILM